MTSSTPIGGGSNNPSSLNNIQNLEYVESEVQSTLVSTDEQILQQQIEASTGDKTDATSTASKTKASGSNSDQPDQDPLIQLPTDNSVVNPTGSFKTAWRNATNSGNFI